GRAFRAGSRAGKVAHPADLANVRGRVVTMPVTSLSVPSPETAAAPVAHPGADRMTGDFLRAARLAVFGSTLLPLVTTLCSAWLLPGPDHQVRMRELLLHFVLIAGANVAATLALSRGKAAFDGWSRAQATFLDELPLRRVDLAIVAAAGLSLFLELAVIRWQGSVFELFALYKNL